MKRIVGVRFYSDNREERGMLGDKQYCYFTDIDDLKIGDHVIVVVGDVPKAVMVTTIAGLSKSDQAKAHKWIAQRIDLTDYYIKIKKQELIAEIEDELDRELAKAQRYEVFKSVAKSSPVMMELLKKLHDLDPSVTLIDISTSEDQK